MSIARVGVLSLLLLAGVFSGWATAQVDRSALSDESEWLKPDDPRHPGYIPPRRAPRPDPAGAPVAAPVAEDARPSERARLSETERREKAIRAVIEFHEKSGGRMTAERIRKGWDDGDVLVAGDSLFAHIGIDMDEGNAFYWMGRIYIPENALPVDWKGEVDYPAVVSLAGTLAHELIHADDESILGRAFLSSKAEREIVAYSRTLESYYHAAKARYQTLRGLDTPCSDLTSAHELVATVTEFKRHYHNEIRPKDIARNDRLKRELAANVAELNKARRLFENSANEDIGYRSLVKEEEALISQYASALQIAPSNARELGRRFEALKAKRAAYVSANAHLSQQREIVNRARRLHDEASKKYKDYWNQDVIFDVSKFRITELPYEERGLRPQLHFELERVRAELAANRQDTSYSATVMQRRNELEEMESALRKRLASWTVDEAEKNLDTLSDAARKLIADCEKDPNSRLAHPVTGGPGYVTSQHQQKDWYCTNRPSIEAPVALPPILRRN